MDWGCSHSSYSGSWGCDGAGRWRWMEQPSPACPLGWMLRPVGGITYLALRRVLFDTYMADQRLPIALAFMIIACAHLDLRDEFVRRGFATVLVLLLAVRAFEVQGVWREISRGTAS